MDEFTKRKVKRALNNNPDLPVRMVIRSIRFKQKHPDKMLYRRVRNES